MEETYRKYYAEDNTVFSCQYHVVFCIKYRRKVLHKGIDMRLKEIIQKDQERYEYQVIEMEVMPDFVHMVLDATPRFSILDTVSHIKAVTSRALRLEFPSLKTRLPSLWTRESFIVTVGEASMDVINEYIASRRRQQ